MESIIWQGNRLINDFKGALLMICHDHDFMHRLGIPQDRMAKRLEMVQKTIHYHLGKMPVLANSLNGA
ncbi:MAG: hypothetical protein KAH09_01310 [Desulfobacula sp.]|nr:hypothetical protein [Desulfobacula sp.]